MWSPCRRRLEAIPVRQHAGEHAFGDGLRPDRGVAVGVATILGVIPCDIRSPRAERRTDIAPPERPADALDDGDVFRGPGRFLADVLCTAVLRQSAGRIAF